MPIYYQKISQNEDENMNFINSLDHQPEKLKVAKLANKSRANSYYELSEFDSASASSLLSDDRVYLQENVELEKIETRYGPVIVGKQTYSNGQPVNHHPHQHHCNSGSATNGQKPTATVEPNGAIKEQRKVKLNSIILSIHDIGLNHEANFQHFFNSPDAKVLLKNFSLYHLDLPGQHTSAKQFDSAYCYPTMDQMSEIIDFVVSYYDIQNFIGFGQGCGANLLIRFAIKKPNKVNGLFLINPTYAQASWVEWIYQKRNIKHLQANRNLDQHANKCALSPIVQDYLIWHQFGKTSPERDLDSLRIIEEYRAHFKSRFIDPINLSLLIDAYVKRKLINLSRDGLKGTNKLQCDCTILTGSLSSMRNESNQLYTRLSAERSNWCKFDNCGNPLLERPTKVFEIFKLFLLGLGYTVKQHSRPSQLTIKKSASASLTATGVLNEANSCLIDFFTPN